MKSQPDTKPHHKHSILAGNSRRKIYKSQIRCSDVVTKLSQDPGHIQIVCSVNDDQNDDIISYNDTMNHITNQ